MIDCPYFRKCGAPLCPLDPESLEHGIWFPDDPVCRRRPAPDWVKAQKKIKRKATCRDCYFTFEMLNSGCVIGKGITGLSPDSKADEKERLRRWLRQHKPRKPLSSEKREKLRQRMLQIRKNSRNLS